jgi:hypothetical protein
MGNNTSEYVDSAIQTKPDDSQVQVDLSNQLMEWLRICEGSIPETNWRTESVEDYDFYAGKQDDLVTLEKLAEQKRPNTTYNEVKPKVDMLVGIGAQMKQSPILKPRGQEDEARTELMNGTLSFVRYECKVSRKEMECFEHMTKSGRSFLHFWIDTENPYEPDIKSKFIHGRDVLLDPDSTEYDLSDARFIFVSKWFTEEDIRVKYPNFPFDAIKTLSQSSNDKPTFFDPGNKKYRIVEGWYRTYVPVVWFTNPMSGQPEFMEQADFDQFNMMVQTTGLPQPDGSFRKIPAIQGIQRMRKKIMYAHFSGQVILEAGPTTFKGTTASQFFPFIQFGAYKDDAENRWFGVISMMKDPQRGLNTVRRQLIHLLQTAPKGILIHEAGAIVNEDNYEEKSSEPNFRLVVTRGMLDKIKFSDQPQISPIYGQLDELFVQTIKNVSGVQDSLLGIQTSSREPGVTVKMRQETGIAVLYILFSNFKESRLNAAKFLVDLIQQYYTAPRVIRVQGQQGEQLMELNTQLDPTNPDYNGVDSGRYDVVVDEDVENITMRAFIMEQLTAYSQNNPGMIPPDVIMEYSNLPFTAKMAVKNFNAQNQAAQAQAVQFEQQMQIEELNLKKTELALRAKEMELKHEVDLENAKNKSKGGAAK